jgi:hypothetical protein
MAFNALGIMLLVRSAWEVELSVCMGVQVCGCPISLRVCHIETAVLALMNSALSSASAADDIIALYLQYIEYPSFVYGKVLIACREHVASCSAASLGF